VAVEQLTYLEIAARLNISREAPRALIKRHRLARTRGNDGKILVAIDFDEVQHNSKFGRSPRGYHAVGDAAALLEQKIKTLEAELTAERERSQGHRSDFEQERARVTQLMAELLTATGELMKAREVTSRLEGENAILRSLRSKKPAKTGWREFLFESNPPWKWNWRRSA
jgi:hypothetical protein